MEEESSFQEQLELEQRLNKLHLRSYPLSLTPRYDRLNELRHHVLDVLVLIYQLLDNRLAVMFFKCLSASIPESLGQHLPDCEASAVQ